MILRLKLAIRNTFRNRRRTALNIFMIAGGVSSVILFEGFARNLVTGLRETTIKTQTGHLQIASEDYWTKKKNSKNCLLSQYRKIIADISKDPRVSFASGRIIFFGLLSHGDESVSSQGISFEPGEEKERNRSFNFVKGRALSGKNPYQVALGYGLAKKMGVKSRDRVTILANTYDGVVNAIDMEVVGIFRTAISEFDDNSFLLPLSAAQKLLDTEAAEQIVVGLKNTAFTNSVWEALEKKLKMNYPHVKVKPWYHLAKLYNQVSSFNHVQNRIVEFIILALILLGILNTVGMSVFERTGEIGTARAMGESEGNILFQFVLEGVILGVVGATVGMALGVGLASLINAAKIPVIMPGASTLLTIRIDIFADALRGSTLLAILSATVSAFIPAYRASRLNIAEALKRNI